MYKYNTRKYDKTKTNTITVLSFPASAQSKPITYLYTKTNKVFFF